MGELERAIDSLAARTGFSGAVRVDRGDDVELAEAYGFAHRGYEIANTVDTRFAIASGTKGPHRSHRGQPDRGRHRRAFHDGPLGARRRSAARPRRRDGRAPPRSPVGHRRLPRRGGRRRRRRLPDAGVRARARDDRAVPRRARRPSGVCEPAGMHDTEFLRSDELPGRCALGYATVDGAARSNVFRLPVRGSGDGGIYSTLADVSSFWRALFAGRIVSPSWAAEMVRARSDVPEQSLRYGLGLWLHASSDVAMLEGCDAGVSFRSVHDPARRITHTVVSNTSDGAWPVARLLDEQLATVASM